MPACPWFRSINFRILLFPPGIHQPAPADRIASASRRETPPSPWQLADWARLWVDENTPRGLRAASYQRGVLSARLAKGPRPPHRDSGGAAAPYHDRTM